MATTNNLGITLVDQSQAQKEVTINQAFSLLDAVTARLVVDKDLSTPPTSPAPSALYIVAASPTGAWSGKATNLAYFDQVWRFIVPQTGMSVWVEDEAVDYRFNGTSWAKALNDGTASFAAGASSVTVTSAACTSSSIVLATVRSNDTTLKSVQAVPGSGSFTLYGNAAATAAATVGYLVIN